MNDVPYISKLAQEINQRGLTTPVILLLEMHKPLGNFIYHSALLASPLLSMIFGAARFKNFETFWQKSENIEALIIELEKLQVSKSKKGVAKCKV